MADRPTPRVRFRGAWDWAHRLPVARAEYAEAPTEREDREHPKTLVPPEEGSKMGRNAFLFFSPSRRAQSRWARDA